MFRIKICGITDAKSALLASLAGADAIGLNFYHKSPRRIDLATADEVVAVVADRVVKVGLFVNAPIDEIIQVSDRLNLDLIQLHGDEPPEMLGSLGDRKIVRAFRLGENGVPEIADYLEKCRGARLPNAVLIDAKQPGRYGGTGSVVDWQAVLDCRGLFGDLPLVLAGGLTPFNVAEAITKVRPSAVDTASGVESQPGHKDPLMLRAFVIAAKSAFAKLGKAD